jgi:hypothetical protein
MRPREINVSLSEALPVHIAVLQLQIGRGGQQVRFSQELDILGRGASVVRPLYLRLASAP